MFASAQILIAAAANAIRSEDGVVVAVRSGIVVVIVAKGIFITNFHIVITVFADLVQRQREATVLMEMVERVEAVSLMRRRLEEDIIGRGLR